MQQESLIPLSQFCVLHQVEISFINTLNEFGIIEIINVDNDNFISMQQLPLLEKTIRLHDELGINPEGIDTINHLLDKVNSLQNELTILQNKLRLYED